MKTKIIALIAFASPLVAQEPLPVDLNWKSANRGSISIDVQETRRGVLKADYFKTDYGSYDKYLLRVRSMVIEVRNSSPTAKDVTTEVLWFIAPERAHGERTIQVHPAIGERKVISKATLSGLRTLKIEASTMAEANKARFAALGESYSNGVKFAGWAVIVRQESTVLTYKASSPTIQKVIADTAALKTALESLTFNQ
jgi:hypothetical protein